jgi:hypothetical protein
MAAMKIASATAAPLSTSAPLVSLIEQIAKRKDAAHVYIKRNGLTLRLERRLHAR